eukprot:gene26287-biopygen15555
MDVYSTQKMHGHADDPPLCSEQQTGVTEEEEGENFSSDTENEFPTPPTTN